MCQAYIESATTLSDIYMTNTDHIITARTSVYSVINWDELSIHCTISNYLQSNQYSINDSKLHLLMFR